MKGVAMYYTVKTMLEHGKSISAIARDLGIDRKNVRKIRDRVKNGEIKTPVMKRKSKLDTYKEEIIGYTAPKKVGHVLKVELGVE